MVPNRSQELQRLITIKARKSNLFNVIVWAKLILPVTTLERAIKHIDPWYSAWMLERCWKFLTPDERVLVADRAVTSPGSAWYSLAYCRYRLNAVQRIEAEKNVALLPRHDEDHDFDC